MKNPMRWKWFAWGKHPGVRDLECAGTQTPFFKRFIKWVDDGSSMFDRGSRLRTRHCSWRFWTKGIDNQVVCGLVRNRCDSNGSSYPSLYIGAGDLENWQSNCAMLPFVFESIWKRFEFIASARLGSIQQLNDYLQIIQQPLPEWRKYQQRINGTANLLKTAKCEEKVDGRKRLIKIDCGQSANLPYDLQFCDRVIDRGEDQSPPAVFISEIEACVIVAFMNSTLSPSDFVWLWDLDQKNTRKFSIYETQ